MKARGGRLEVVARGRKGHSPRDWIRLKEERRKVDIGVGQQVRKALILWWDILLCPGVDGEDGA